MNKSINQVQVKYQAFMMGCDIFAIQFFHM